MKIFRFVAFLIVLLLPLTLTTFAAPNVGASANTCAVTWQAVTVPNAGNLAAIQAISATDIWVGGDGDFLHWDGAEWTTIAKPESAAVTRISASASNDVWALAGNNMFGAPRFYHWDGVNWTSVALPTQSSLYDVYAVAANNVWLVGGNQAYHWDGSVWEAHAPNEDWYAGLYTITAVGDQIYAAGKISYHVEPSAIYKWNGTDWSIEYQGIWGSITRLAPVSPNVVWALGNTYPFERATVWNGAAWVDSELPTQYHDIAAFATDDAYVVGNDILHWDGSEWLYTFTPSHPLRAISALSTTDIWAVGDSSIVLHGMGPCAATGCAQTAMQLKPKYDTLFNKQSITLKWADQPCATVYKYVVTQDTKQGARVARGKAHKSNVTTPALARGHDYYWRVRACNAVSCGAWSYWSEFEIKP